MEMLIHIHLKLNLMVANDDTDSGGFSSQTFWKPAGGNMNEASGENVALPSTAGSLLCWCDTVVLPASLAVLPGPPFQF